MSVSRDGEITMVELLFDYQKIAFVQSRASHE